MVHEFKLPDVGEGITEAEILKWMVDEGAGVREDDPLAEVETDKAIIEIPSPVDGSVKRLHADVGETVAVGETLVTFDTDDDGEEARNDGGVEILDSDGNAAVDVDAEGAEDESGEDEREERETEEGDKDRSFASPSTRRLAREVGVDIDEVEGSGENGRVVAQDVLHAAKEKQEKREDERGTPASPTARGKAREKDVDIDDVPPTGDDDGEEFVTEEDVDEFASHPGAGGKTPTMEEDDGPTPEFGQDTAPAVEPDTSEDTSMFGGGDTPVAQRTDETEVAEDDEPSPRVRGVIRDRDRRRDEHVWRRNRNVGDGGTGRGDLLFRGRGGTGCRRRKKRVESTSSTERRSQKTVRQKKKKTSNQRPSSPDTAARTTRAKRTRSSVRAPRTKT